jgi:hypothetical protein
MFLKELASGEVVIGQGLPMEIELQVAECNIVNIVIYHLPKLLL